MYVNEHFPIVWDPARCRQTHNLSQARTFTQDSPNRAASFSIRFVTLSLNLFPPPARWRLLDFMSVASSPPPPPLLLLPDLNHDHPPPVFPAGPQPRLSTPSVPCRTSTTIIHTQCSLPDLNWAWILAVEVRQGTLGVDGRGWGPAGNTATSRSQWALPTPNGKNVRKDVR